MKHLLYLLLILPFILAPSSCTTVKAELPNEPVQTLTPTPTPKPVITINHEDEIRFALVLILTNQLCTQEGEINRECRDYVIKCHHEMWEPTNKIVKCFEEWGKP